jgi:hypothetical protein
MNAPGDPPTDLRRSQRSMEWLGWAPGERETYSRRGTGLIWGGVVLTLLAIWWIVNEGPSPTPFLGIAGAGTLVVVGTGSLASMLQQAVMPRQISISDEGVSIRRRGTTILIPWARFRGLYSGSIWYAGHTWVAYRRSGGYDLGAFWVSRMMSEALLARPETSSWRQLRAGRKPR